MALELWIQNGDTLQEPITEDEIVWELERQGAPGKLTFSVKPDGVLNFQEGNRVTLCKDGRTLFLGYVFQKQRNKQGIIAVTAYDQLRYLKNKDTCNFKNLTATEIVKQLASDFELRCGELEDTGFKIATQVEDSSTLFDMIQTALDTTLQQTGRMYILFDAFGYLTLKNVESMKLDLLINAETAQDFDYTSSIDGETYNRIKLVYDNEDSGLREKFVTFDSATMANWGVLQYFEVLQSNLNGKSMADSLLKLYNRKTRSLVVNGCFGDPRVRAGSAVGVALNLGDIIANSYMMVEKVTHTFKENEHTMDLTLRGGTYLV